MVENDIPSPPVLIRHYSDPSYLEKAIYNYIRYIEDIKLRNYNELQINTVCKYAVNIMKHWYLPNNINVWNDSINNWLEKQPINKIYHEIIFKMVNNIPPLPEEPILLIHNLE